MTTRAEYLDLAEAVEHLPGPDREVDAKVCDALSLASLTPGTDVFVLPKLTGSTDAVEALVAKVLPGYGWGLDGSAVASGASVYSPLGSRAVYALGNATSPCRALLAAALRAMAEGAGE